MRITLRRSLIGVPKRQRDTVHALGLRKIGDARELEASRDLRGMVDRIAYLLEIEEDAS